MNALKAKRNIAARSTADLCGLFERTNKKEYSQAVAVVRGLLMDEIEERNPQGFAKWLEEYAPDNELKNYVL